MQFTLDRLDIPKALVLQSNFTLVCLPAGEAGSGWNPVFGSRDESLVGLGNAQEGGLGVAPGLNLIL